MKIPNHIAIIPDGNRRWARERSLPTFVGHKKGLENFYKIARHAQQLGVKYLTFFAFSTENWKRSKQEVEYLMRLFKGMLTNKNIQKLKRRGVRLNFIGQIERLPSFLREKIRKTHLLTKSNNDFVLSVAISYGGRADILQAIRKLIKKKISPRKINEEMFASYLWTKDLPEPDLVIRTGKEKRISNFLLWQMAYSELYFSNKYWPEFSEKELEKAIRDYSRRKRRFGK